MKISSNFDAGAIEVVRLDDPVDIRLRLRADDAADPGVGAGNEPGARG